MSKPLQVLAAAAAADVDEDTASEINPTEACSSLRAAFERYDGPVPFKTGDFVTPRADSNVKDAGKPHVVLDVMARPEPDFVHASGSQDTCSNTFGSRRDIRVASLTHGRVCAYWVESFCFEPYALPGAPLSAA